MIRNGGEDSRRFLEWNEAEIRNVFEFYEFFNNFTKICIKVRLKTLGFAIKCIAIGNFGIFWGFDWDPMDALSDIWYLELLYCCKYVNSNLP